MTVRDENCPTVFWNRQKFPFSCMRRESSLFHSNTHTKRKHEFSAWKDSFLIKCCNAQKSSGLLYSLLVASESVKLWIPIAWTGHMWILFNPTNPVSKCFFVWGGDHIDLSESVPNPANVEKCLSVWAEGRGKSPEGGDVERWGSHLLTAAPRRKPKQQDTPPPPPHTHTHSPTLPRSAAGPGTRAAGRSPRAELECWLFITDVLVLFLPVLQIHRAACRVAKTITTTSMHRMRYASRHFKIGSKNYITTNLFFFYKFHCIR